MAIYTDDHQIKRMKEITRDYERGRCDGDTLYDFLVELNQTKRDLTYEEEILVTESKKEK